MIYKALDGFDIIKMMFINGGVLSFVTLADFETILKIILLVLTIVYTTFKIIQLIKKK